MKIPPIYKTFFPKPGIGIPVNYSKLRAGNTVLVCSGKSEKVLEAELGTTAVQIAEGLLQKFAPAIGILF